MRRFRNGAMAAALLLAAGGAEARCAGAEGPCSVASGEYHIVLPDRPGPYPALVMLHGAGGRGEGMVDMLATKAAERGWAVIGPQGVRRPGSRFSSSWSFHPNFEPLRDEAGFVREVLEDAVERHGIDRAQVVLGGFSIGGSMASYIACSDPGIARAYAPTAGSFWRPHPEPGACAGPVDVLHSHGWSDGVVPIEGRVLGNGRLLQGDVFAAMEIWRGVNGCGKSAPDEITLGEAYWSRIWRSCAAGSLRFDLYQGGHGVPPGWLDTVVDWFETLD